MAALTSILPQARALLQGLSEDLTAAVEGGEVHGARRRIKRLRSLALLARPAIGEDAYREAKRHLKVAADALSGLRRAEALTLAVDRLVHALPKAHGLHLLLSNHRATHAGGMAQAQALDTARAALSETTSAVSRWTIDGPAAPLLAKAFAGTYRAARKQLLAALDSGKTAELHEARKLVIHHLHHLELLSDQLQEDPAERIAALNALREALGDLNDLAELERLAKDSGQRLSKAVRKAMAARRTKLMKTAGSSWKPLFGQKTKAFARRIGAMWPPDAS